MLPARHQHGAEIIDAMRAMLDAFANDIGPDDVILTNYFSVRDGKIVEYWSVVDFAGILAQLGHMPIGGH